MPRCLARALSFNAADLSLEFKVEHGAACYHTELVAPTDTVLKTVEAVLQNVQTKISGSCVKKLTRMNVPAATEWRLGVRTSNRGLELLNTSKKWMHYLSWVPLATMKGAFVCCGWPHFYCLWLDSCCHTPMCR